MPRLQDRVSESRRSVDDFRSLWRSEIPGFSVSVCVVSVGFLSVVLGAVFLAICVYPIFGVTLGAISPLICVSSVFKSRALT